MKDLRKIIEDRSFWFTLICALASIGIVALIVSTLTASSGDLETLFNKPLSELKTKEFFGILFFTLIISNYFFKNSDS